MAIVEEDAGAMWLTSSQTAIPHVLPHSMVQIHSPAILQILKSFTSQLIVHF